MKRSAPTRVNQYLSGTYGLCEYPPDCHVPMSTGEAREEAAAIERSTREVAMTQHVPWLLCMEVVVTGLNLDSAGRFTFTFVLEARYIRPDGSLDFALLGHRFGMKVESCMLSLTSRGNVQVLLDALRLKRGEPHGFLLPPGALSSSWAYVPHADSSPLPRPVASGETELKALLAAWAVGGSPSSKPELDTAPVSLKEVGDIFVAQHRQTQLVAWGVTEEQARSNLNLVLAGRDSPVFEE